MSSRSGSPKRRARAPAKSLLDLRAAVGRVYLSCGTSPPKPLHEELRELYGVSLRSLPRSFWRMPERAQYLACVFTQDPKASAERLAEHLFVIEAHGFAGVGATCREAWDQLVLNLGAERERLIRKASARTKAEIQRMYELDRLPCFPWSRFKHEWEWPKRRSATD